MALKGLEKALRRDVRLVFASFRVRSRTIQILAVFASLSKTSQPEPKRPIDSQCRTRSENSLLADVLARPPSPPSIIERERPYRHTLFIRRVRSP